MIELILAGNGPGELRGWIAPVARRAQDLAHAEDLRLTVSLALSPSQFAGGREQVVVEKWNLFDRVLDPGRCLRLAAGFGTLDVQRPAVLVHLGGDLLLSGRLAARFGIPAAALAETPLVAGRHHYFERVFAATASLAADLQARGVPASKLVVTGDPRVDAFAVDPAPRGGRSAGDLLVSFMPGSRDRVFAALAPFFLRAAQATEAQRRDVRFQFIVSEFVSPSLVETVRRASPPVRADVEWIIEQGWQAVARSDFVVSIPGTNTLELALAGVPFAVILPTTLMDRAVVEGLWEWIARLPGLGGPLRGFVLARYLRRHRFLAIPNQRAGRKIVPEWIGALTAEDVAGHLLRTLEDAPGRSAITSALRSLEAGPPGASDRIVRGALHLAA